MTPEERAKEIANKISFEVDAHPTSMFCAMVRDWIATAIREAVAAEREACARVAERSDFPDMYARRDGYFAEGWERACFHIAAAIRSRSNEGEEG